MHELFRASRSLKSHHKTLQYRLFVACNISAYVLRQRQVPVMNAPVDFPAPS